MLLAAMAQALKVIDFLPQDNSSYFLLPLREFIHSRPLKRGEFSMLMGVCRQIIWATGKEMQNQDSLGSVSV
jgi:tRNA/rRNA methyltransferase